MISAAALGLALIMMLAELRCSRRNERALRARDAHEPANDVYRTMTWAYPLTFVAMACEGLLTAPRWPAVMLAGGIVFVAAKLLKWWAIVALGDRWTFRVLVVPEPLVTRGPYAWVRHPNYVAVVGELAGFAALVGAPVTGVASLIGFVALLRRRIAVEEQALRLR